MESRDLVLSYLHIGLHTRYEKKDLTKKNRNGHKYYLSENYWNIESYKSLEVTDDEGAIHLLIGIKYIVVVVDTGNPVLTTPHATSLVSYETKVTIEDRGGHTLLSLTRQGIFLYINVWHAISQSSVSLEDCMGEIWSVYYPFLLHFICNMITFFL